MIRNEEALKERARLMSQVPREVDEATVTAMDAACQASMQDHYTLAGGLFMLDAPAHLLTPAERLRILECLQRPNGIQLVLVEIPGDHAELHVHFYNRNLLAEMLADASGEAEAPSSVFRITGGHRLAAGRGPGEVQVTAATQPDPDQPILVLTVAPIGDYSTYTLHLDPFIYAGLDPLFSSVDFKFRPGCFNTDCAPAWDPAPASQPEPSIDYLAKDYDSFRHTLIAWMMERVPSWQATSEADLDQVLLGLFSAAADELSDYQDRVMNEAYLATARKRVSLARHARLVDYHIHQGNQARTWLAIHVAGDAEQDLTEDLVVWAGREDANGDADGDAVIFMSRLRQSDDPHTFASKTLYPLLNRISLYTWSRAVPALAAGSTRADLRLNCTDGTPAADEASARAVEALIRDGRVTRLLIQEHLNPETGYEAGRDPTRRQLVHLLPGDEGAEAMQDPITGEWFVRVRWAEEDQLQRAYCFSVECEDGWIDDVSLFHGNLIEVYHGRVQPVTFRPKDEPLALALTPDDPVEVHYERNRKGEAICQLPAGPLLYQDTPPAGDAPPLSTLSVEVEADGTADPWDEVISLVHSDDGSESGDHFVVETDEELRSLVRFGNGTNGRALPESAVVHAAYQVGRGLDGNVGADTLVHFDSAALDAVWNPFDVTGGRAPEPAAEVLRRAPEAYRYRQLRAVTLKDYVRRAEELPGVATAAARYMWTGSWRTVRLTIDPAGTTTLTDDLRQELARHLDAVRLLGEDLEIRPPRFVPLDLTVTLCVHPDYWPEDLRHLLEQEFSDGFAPDGHLAFFHPDRWTFGKALHASEVLGRVQSVQGVDHVIDVQMQRWNEATPGTPDVITVRPEEIILVKSDPDHQETGRITFDLRGGRA